MSQSNVYGKCCTDYKDGSLKSLFSLRKSFVLNPEYRGAVQNLLEKIGLKLPSDDNNIHHGTEEDLLFLNQYGIVIRIGMNNIPSLIFPLNIQPLGFVKDSKTKITVSVYAGVHIVTKKIAKQVNFNRAEIKEKFSKQSQEGSDLHSNNLGFIISSPLSKAKIDDIYLQNIDVDSTRTGTACRKLKRRKTSSYFHHASRHKLPGTRIREIMIKHYSDMDNFDKYIKAYDTHQALRNMLGRALLEKNAKIRKALLTAFWNRCADVKKTPERVLIHDWVKYKNKHGVDVRRKEEHLIESMSLQSPWAGKREQLFSTKKQSFLKKFIHHIFHK